MMPSSLSGVWWECEEADLHQTLWGVMAWIDSHTGLKPGLKSGGVVNNPAWHFRQPG